MKKFLSVAVVLCLLFISCKKEQKNENSLFVKLEAGETGVKFENTLTSTVDNNIFKYEYFYNGGGVAAADFNNDGLTDLYFTGNQVSSRLYLNQGNFKFQDVTDSAKVGTKGWCTGVAVVDINQDGWMDIYVCHAGLKTSKNQLFINQGKQKNNKVMFAEKASEYGLDYKGYSTHAAFFDYDKDGDLDLYLLNHYQSNTNFNFPKDKTVDGSDPSNDKLFRNDGLRFTEVSKEIGITTEGFGLGVAICDINADGWEDVYVSNDFIFDDLIYINNKNGTFTESASQYLKHTSRFSMGCDIADFNNDSYQDIIVVDMLPDDNRRQKLMSPATNQSVFNFSIERGYLPQFSRNVLQLNNGPDSKGEFSFSEIGQLANVYKTDWSWSPLFLDLDNDGWKDLYISNGIPKDVTNNDFLKYKHIQNKNLYSDPAALQRELLSKLEEMENVDKSDFAFLNRRNLTFADATDSLGLNEKGFSNGVVQADLDNDGDLEIIVNNINANPTIYKNRSSELLKNNFLRIKLQGKYSLGSKLKIVTNGKAQYAENRVYRGFQSTQEEIIHFGLGEEQTVDTLEIKWLDGKMENHFNVKANQLLIFNHDKSSDTLKVVSDSFFVKKMPKPLFIEVTDEVGLDYIHQENVLEDFNMESLLPHRYSRNGPYISTGDIDKNGLEDFWIGGPATKPGKIFLQQANNKFKIQDLPDVEHEDMGGLLFDADGDDDLDLYVVSGGNEYFNFNQLYQDRLYINTGKGIFKRDSTALPVETISGSCVVGSDFDKDGDIDLFVGGRLLPNNYPFPAQSLILRNNGKGKFEDVTAEVCPELAKIGLITSAEWRDFDNDNQVDLILVGEWIPLTFFKNTNGKLSRISDPEIKYEKGWWFSLASGDFDKDGDLDFVAGNLGLNSKLKASADLPVWVYAKDFNANGQIKPVLTYYFGNQEFTVANKDQLSEHIPSIRKKFLNYEAFAKATFQEVFKKEELDKALILKANNFNSVYVENLGQGKFKMQPLPIQAQFSVVQKILVNDYNNDGNLDLLIGGNFFGPDYITGRYDASIGVLLTGDGKGQFKALSAKESGINFKGDTRSIVEFKLGNKNLIISAPNQGKLQFFELSK